MYRAFLFHGVVADNLKLLHRCAFFHSCVFCHIMNAVNASIPYDVVNINVVADKQLLVVVNVDYSNESVSLRSEIIKERRVLTEWIISVSREIRRRLIVAEKDYDTALYELLELGASVDVGFFAEHIVCFIFIL